MVSQRNPPAMFTGAFGALGQVVARTLVQRGARVALLDAAPSVPAALAEEFATQSLMPGIDLSGQERFHIALVKDTLPRVYQEASAIGSERAPRTSDATSSRVNVVDEEGRIIFGPPLRSGEFTVGVRFPTTLYNWRLQVSPKAADELASRVQNRRSLEMIMLVLSCIVIVAGVATILVAAEKERLQIGG